MSRNPHARAALDYLENLCRRMDRGLRPRRPSGAWWRAGACLPAGVSLCLVAACSPAEAPPRSPSHATMEVCGDGIDNDGNGLVDCDDRRACNCRHAGVDPVGPGPNLGPERGCDDGLDDDGDGRVDCDDPDCYGVCRGAEYMAPIERPSEADCSNGRDDDGDGKVDYADEDCHHAVALYAAPVKPQRVEDD